MFLEQVEADRVCRPLHRLLTCAREHIDQELTLFPHLVICEIDIHIEEGMKACQHGVYMRRRQRLPRATPAKVEKATINIPSNT